MLVQVKVSTRLPSFSGNATVDGEKSGNFRYQAGMRKYAFTRRVCLHEPSDFMGLRNLRSSPLMSDVLNELFVSISYLLRQQ